MSYSQRTFAAFYGPAEGLFVYYSVGVCALITLLLLGAVAFGIAIGLFAVLIAGSYAGPSVLERLPPSALILVVAYSGLFNDFRLSALVVLAAMALTPLIAVIESRGSISLLPQIVSITKVWLPAGVAASSLTALAARDAASAGLFLVLIYFHDLGLKVCAHEGSQRRWAPVVALSGILAVLWTSAQMSISRISPEQYWLFACMMGIAIPLGRLTMQLFVFEEKQKHLLHASHALAAPLWTAGIVVLTF